LISKYDQILKTRLVKEFDDFFKLVNFDMKQKLQALESNFRVNLMDIEKRLNFLGQFRDPEINQVKLSIQSMVNLYDEQ